MNTWKDFETKHYYVEYFVSIIKGFCIGFSIEKRVERINLFLGIILIEIDYEKKD